MSRGVASETRTPTLGWVHRLTSEPASPGFLQGLRSDALKSRTSVVWASGFVVAASIVAWLVTLNEMTGMDAGPGADLGALGAFVAFWVTMMAAMMLPSELPMIVLYSRTARGGRLDTIAFVLGYLATWMVYGLAAYGGYWLIETAAGGILAWD